MRFFISLFFLFLISTNSFSTSLGTLRIIADFGSKENISLKECSASDADDFIFANDDTTDANIDVIYNKPDVTNFYLCSIDSINSTSTNIKYTDFAPTIILFNDTGIKAVPSLYTKKLLSTSNLNTILLGYLKNGNVIDFFTAISKFNIDHFYLAMSNQMYTNVKDNIDDFYTFLDTLPEKLKDDDLTKRVFIEKITQIKELYSFAFDLYSKVYLKYENMEPASFLNIWQSGYTEENFCGTEKSNYDTCISCINNRAENDFSTYSIFGWISNRNYNSCASSCSGILGYTACKSQASISNSSTKTISKETDKCFYDNCISYSPTYSSITSSDTTSSSIASLIENAQYGTTLSDLDSSSTQIYNFAKIPYTNVKVDNVKNDDGSVNTTKTLANKNIACREKIVNALGKTFNYYSKKYSFSDPSTELNLDLDNYPVIKNFSNIVLDIHSNLITNDIGSLINDTINSDCISGDLNNNTYNDEAVDYHNNKKVINFVSILKNDGISNFYNYSSKIYGLNLYSNFLQTETGLVENKTLTGTIDTTTTISGDAGGLTSEDTSTEVEIDDSDTSNCDSDEYVLVLFFDDLANNLYNASKINAKLNKELTNNESSGFFDVANYGMYIGCYKDGYITKFLGKRAHTVNDKNELLECYAKWLNESDSSSDESDEDSDTNSKCLDYFYNDLDSSNIEYLYNKFDDKLSDQVIFGSIAHFNIYNDEDFTEKLNGPTGTSSEYTAASGTFKDTNIFKNIIPTIPYNNFILEKYTLKETVCTIFDEYSETTSVDENGTTITTPIKGKIGCYKNTANQKLINYQHDYDYNVQDYLFMINSYIPVQLSNIKDLTDDQKNQFTLSESYKAFTLITNKTETNDCPVIYNNENVTSSDYIEEEKNCLGDGDYYSDYNTDTMTSLKSKFNDYITPITYFAEDIGVTLSTSLTEDNFYTYQFPSVSLFYYYPAYVEDSLGITANSRILYEINQDNKEDIVNSVNGNDSSNITIKNEEMILNEEDTNLDTTKYDVSYIEQNIDISKFSTSSLSKLDDLNVVIVNN